MPISNGAHRLWRSSRPGTCGSLWSLGGLTRLYSEVTTVDIVLPAARLVVFTACLHLLAGTAALFATGPSFATMKITPIAASEDGVVLFKTYSHINRMGRHSQVGAEYGWLCASSAGLWKERLHYRVTDDSYGSRDFDIVKNAFNRRADLSDPPASLSDLIEECGLAEARALSPEEGKGRAVWSAGRFCLDERCSSGYVQQRSLGGLTSKEYEGRAVESLFFFEGLALFENVSHYELPEAIGATFPIPNLIGGVDVGLDQATISGISTIPRAGVVGQ